MVESSDESVDGLCWYICMVDIGTKVNTYMAAAGLSGARDSGTRDLGNARHCFISCRGQLHILQALATSVEWCAVAALINSEHQATSC